MTQVHEGMHVVDAAGKDVGRVKLVQMGDAEADTTEGNEDRETQIDFFAEALGGEHEPDVAEPLRSRLIRSGFIKVDSPNPLKSDHYVPSDYVREVSGDRVRLSVRQDEMPREK